MFLACAPAPDKPDMVDPAAERNAVLGADRAFAKATAERRLEGWLEFFAEDGAMFPAGSAIAKGEEQIRTLMGPVFEEESYSLTWEPDGSEVSLGGDLGYTHGTYRSEVTEPEGTKSVSTGKYVTIWRKQADGQWRVVVDIGNQDPPTTESVN
jgi:uncharacterized protein (TIGR02246 family)